MYFVLQRRLHSRKLTPCHPSPRYIALFHLGNPSKPCLLPYIVHHKMKRSCPFPRQRARWLLENRIAFCDAKYTPQIVTACSQLADVALLLDTIWQSKCPRRSNLGGQDPGSDGTGSTYSIFFLFFTRPSDSASRMLVVNHEQFWTRTRVAVGFQPLQEQTAGLAPFPFSSWLASPQATVWDPAGSVFPCPHSNWKDLQPAAASCEIYLGPANLPRVLVLSSFHGLLYISPLSKHFSKLTG